MNSWVTYEVSVIAFLVRLKERRKEREEEGKVRERMDELKRETNVIKEKKKNEEE